MLNSDRKIRFIAMGLFVIISISMLIFLAFTLPSVNGATLSNAKAPNSSVDVIIDADPGADDAMAILLLLSKLSRVNVLAITTVTGNTGVVNGTKNALLILKVANRLDIPVYSGSEQGMVSFVKTDSFFGEDGLGDVFSKKPPLTLRKDGHAATVLADYIRKRPGEITVLCTGPVTNIALAQHIYPKFLDNVKEIVMLGTSYQGAGNIRPGVEFNTFLDPEAASFMFSKVPPGKTITVVPMETVESAFTSLDWRINILGRIGSCYMDFMNKAEVISLSKAKKWQPFDQLAASIILKPEIISSTKYSYYFVETCGNHGRGAAFRDDEHQTSNVKLVTGVKKEMFKELLLTYMNNTSSGCLDLFK